MEPKTYFPTISPEELDKVLNLSIKEDRINRLVLFLSMLLTYTEQDQVNVFISGPSSIGKTFLSQEVSKLFPQEDVKTLSHTSPTSFFHEATKTEDGENIYEFDMSKKIYLFLDQQHTKLLEYLRPILSHDKKVVEHHITDKDQKYGLRTKIIKIIGYPTVIYCSATNDIDDQELTRCISISPQVTQTKLKASIGATIARETDRTYTDNSIEENPERKSLIQRIQAIKESNTSDVIIPFSEQIGTMFSEKHSSLKPRHQRDITKIIRITKAFTLLNMWQREMKNKLPVATLEDLNSAFEIWEHISLYQDYGIPSHNIDIYLQIIVPLSKYSYLEGTTKERIIKEYRKKFGGPLDFYQLNRYILPSLVSAGLITLEASQSNRREKVILIADNT